MGAKMLTDLFDPELDKEERKVMSRVQQTSATKEMAASLMQLTFQSDVADLARSVTTPTFPNATFHPLEGNAHVPWAGDVDTAVEAILEFCGKAGSGARAACTTPAHALTRSGEVWTLTFGGETIHLKHARGLSDLAVLLAHPDQEIPAEMLWAGAEATPRAPG